MFGYTPPQVIAIDASLLRDCSGYQQVAMALESQMMRRPVWAVVHAPDDLRRCRDMDELHDMVEALMTDPRIPLHAYDPDRYTVAAWAERATARILQAHLEDYTIHVPEVALSDEGDVPRHPAGITAGRVARDRKNRLRVRHHDYLNGALQAATELGSSQVTVWCHASDAAAFRLDPEIESRATEAGITFKAEPPRMAGPVPAIWP